jgi:hypothetical protein
MLPGVYLHGRSSHQMISSKIGLGALQREVTLFSWILDIAA